MCFLNAVVDKMVELGEDFRKSDKPQRDIRLKKFVDTDPILQTRLRLNDETIEIAPDYLHHSRLSVLFADFEKLFDLYSADIKLDEIVRANSVPIEEKYSLITPWPYRIRDEDTREDFNALVNSSVMGWERYFEFRRKG